MSHEMYSREGGAVVIKAEFSRLSSRERKYPSKAMAISPPFLGTFPRSSPTPFSHRALLSHGTTLISDGNGSTANHTSTASQQQENQHDGRFQALWVVAFAGVTVMVLICLVAAFFCTKRRHCRRRRHRNRAMQRAEAASAAARPEGSSTAVVANKIRQQSPEERYANIEAWLVSKTVTGHDAVCDRVRATKTMTSSLRSSGSLSSLGENQTAISSCTVKNHSCVSDVGKEELATDRDNRNQNNNERNECPICFDTIEPGDVVSWSPQPDCGHVFHHECIKEWLLKNHNCPYCRQTCLPIDAIAETNKQQIKELLVARQYRDMPCFYCVEHGIVRPPGHLLRLSQHKRQKIITARTNSDNNDKNKDTSWNHDFGSCEEEAVFVERLLDRSHEAYCRMALKRLRGNTIDCNDDDDDELRADLENQTAVSLVDDGEEDHRESFRELR